MTPREAWRDQEFFVPSGPHGMGDDREHDIPTAAELEQERIERDAPDEVLQRRRRR